MRCVRAHPAFASYFLFARCTRWLLGHWLLCIGLAAAAASPPQADWWVENGESLTPRAVHDSAPAGFQPVAQAVIYPLGPGKTLWLRVRLPQAPGGLREPWRLEIPVPLLNAVAFAQPAGKDWRVQLAGDDVPVANWPRPGRHPGFDTFLSPDGPTVVYLRVRHSAPVGFAMRSGPAAALDNRSLLEHFAVGLALGALTLLSVWCLLHAAIHRDLAYAEYAVYTILLTLTCATITGMAAYLLWDESPRWANAAQSTFPFLLAGTHLLFLRQICSCDSSHPVADKAALCAGVAILVAAAFAPFLPTPVVRLLMASSLVTSAALGAVLAAMIWRRGDRVGFYVLLAYVPLTGVVVAVIARLLGLLPASWITFDSAAGASALAVPLLLLAINERARYRQGPHDRLQHLREQDALTGVMSTTLFQKQLASAVVGARDRGEASAVILLEICNLERIREGLGEAAAQEALLRTVIHIHRVIRMSDPVGTTGTTGRFAVIVEGARNRYAIQETLVRLVAGGLSPVRSNPDAPPLQLRLACAMLAADVPPLHQLLRELHALLGEINPGSRRPFRFLEIGQPASGAVGVAEPEARALAP